MKRSVEGDMRMKIRLINAYVLHDSASTCRETTDAFQELIEDAPTVDAIPITYLHAWLDNACEQDDIPMIHALDRILKRWERTHFSASEETENS